MNAQRMIAKGKMNVRDEERPTDKPILDIGVIPGKARDSNIYLLSVNDPKAGLIVVDTGTGAHTDKLIKEMNSHESSNHGVRIILTHCHYDHIGGVRAIVKEFPKVKVYIHSSAVKCLEECDGERTAANAFGEKLEPIKALGLKDEEKLKLGEFDIEVLHTPGHTEDSICLYVPKTKTLFSGDTVFIDGGLGRWDLPTGSLSDLKRSIASIAKLEVSGLYPGHGFIAPKGGSEQIGTSLAEVRSYDE